MVSFYENNVGDTQFMVFILQEECLFIIQYAVRKRQDEVMDSKFSTENFRDT